MKNDIFRRQNENKSIEYLAAQRQLYNEAKQLDAVGVLFSVLIPLLLAIVQVFVEDNLFLNVLSYILSIVSMFVSIYMVSWVEQKKEKAAQIQQKFDIYVFQMPWDEKLFGIEKSVTEIVAEKSKVLLNKIGERERLINWYPDVVNNATNEKGIWICQKENYRWDVNLRKRFKRFSVMIVGVAVFAIIFIGIVKNESVAMMLCRAAFIVPMLQWLLETIKKLNTDIKALEELDELINASGKKTMEELQIIQGKLYLHRKNCYSIPNIFYKKFKENDEDNAHRTATLDLEEW